MKKIFFFVLSMFLISLISAGCSNNYDRQCTPESGYNMCYENSWTCGEATSVSKIQLSNIKGFQKSGYYVGNTWIDYKFTGDNIYLFKNKDSWSTINSQCGGSGCNTETLYGGKYDLTTQVGQEFTDCLAFLSWDRDDNNGWWTYSTAGYGWLGSGNCFGIKQVNCYDDSDCLANQYCSKSGDWKTWSCQSKECNNQEEKCVGTNSYLCENYKWIDKGKIKGKCTVECLSDNDCSNDGFTGEKVCVLNKILQEYSDFSCSLNKCSQLKQTKEIEVCPDVCITDELGATCTERSFFEKNKIVIYSIGVLILIFGGIYFLKKK